MRARDSKPDTAVQGDFVKSLLSTSIPTPGLNFDGVPFPGVVCNCAPPDTNGAVGKTQYLQIVNEGYQVFDKATGNSLLGPASIRSVWAGFGGVCETSGSGDPIALYDKLADRWVISQFAVNGPAPDQECVAVSTTSDATGTWNRYQFNLIPFGNNFYDYPKLGSWPDAYYMKARGWLEHTDRSETQDYIHNESRQIIRDAHPGNWIKQRGTAELMPVDISIEEF